MIDLYRFRLKKAAWSWMEDHAWNQGKFRKDREDGRHEKRGARHDERQEIAREVAGYCPYDEAIEAEYEQLECVCVECLCPR